MEIEESYDVLFNEWNFEKTDWILPLARKCISTKPGERELVRSFEISLCFYLRKFSLEHLEDEVFEFACPASEKFVSEKLIYLEKNPTNCLETLNVFTKILSYFERVFEFLNETPKIAVIEVRSLLIATSRILLSCFSHCRISEEVYGSLFSSLTDFLSNFFKKCCNLLDHLLQLLTEKAECGCEDDREIVVLDELMTSLSKVGIIMIDLEVKTMAKVWKVYALLVERHLHCLKNNHNIGETIKNLCDSIMINMESAFSKNKQDFMKTIKLSCFLLKLIIKFSEVFIECLQNCQNSLLNLLLMLCRLNAGPVAEPKLRQNANQDFLSQLTIGTDSLLSQLMTDFQFIKEISGVSYHVKKTIEFCILCCLAMKKLIDFNSVTRNLWLNKNENILEWIFVSVSSSQFITCSKVCLPSILINGKQKKFTDLYEYVLVTTSTFLMTATSEEYSLIETTLLENILQINPTKALLSTDIWCLLARFADSELCLSQLLTLGKIWQEFHPQTVRVEKCYLASLIRRLFSLLSGSHRGQFLRSFQPSFYCALWEGPAVGELVPIEVCDIRLALLAEVDTLLDVAFDSFEMGIPKGHQSIMFEKFGSKVLKLWKFNCDILPSTCESVKFLKIICTLTASVVADLPSENLLMVLTQMKKLLEVGDQTCTRIFLIWIMASLSAVRIPPGISQKKTITTIGEIFREVLSSKEPLVKEKALEAFYSFSHITSHGEIIAMSVQNAPPELKLEIADYFKRNPNAAGIDFDLDGYMSEVSSLKFQHTCPQRAESESATAFKKVEFGEIVTRWKEEGKMIVQHFHSLTETEKREMKNICNSILTLT